MILAFVGSNPATPARQDSLAQPVEHRTFNAMVRGSNPRWVTSKRTAEAVLFAYPSGMRTPQGFGGCHADACGNEPPCTHVKPYHAPRPDCDPHSTAYTRWVTNDRLIFPLSRLSSKVCPSVNGRTHPCISVHWLFSFASIL